MHHSSMLNTAPRLATLFPTWQLGLVDSLTSYSIAPYLASLSDLSTPRLGLETWHPYQVAQQLGFIV